MARHVRAGLSEQEARRRFFVIDRYGLLVEGMPDITETQKPFVQPRDAVSSWALRAPPTIALLDVMENAKPTALIGTSGQAGAFTEAAIRCMAENVERPVIFPLSNPTSRSEATPEQLMAWTHGRALIGTGSPFPPVTWAAAPSRPTRPTIPTSSPAWASACLPQAQGASATPCSWRRPRPSPLSPAAKNSQDRLLPPVTELRSVSVAVAAAVVRQAQLDGLAATSDETTSAKHIAALVWEPGISALSDRVALTSFERFAPCDPRCSRAGVYGMIASILRHVSGEPASAFLRCWQSPTA